MFLVILLVTVLAQQATATACDRSVAVLVVDGSNACQWAKAKAFDALNCSISVTVPFVRDADKRAVQGTRITLLEHSGGRIDTPDLARRFTALNGRTPRVVCSKGQACHAIRHGDNFALAVSEAEERVRADPGCARRSRDMNS